MVFLKSPWRFLLYTWGKWDTERPEPFAIFLEVSLKDLAANSKESNNSLKCSFLLLFKISCNKKPGGLESRVGEADQRCHRGLGVVFPFFSSQYPGACCLWLQGGCPTSHFIFSFSDRKKGDIWKQKHFQKCSVDFHCILSARMMSWFSLSCKSDRNEILPSDSL